MACAVKYTVPKLPQALVMELKTEDQVCVEEVKVIGPQCG
jgi:hypothetical protein